MKTFLQFLTEALNQDSESNYDKIREAIDIRKSSPADVLKMLNICDKYAQSNVTNTRTLDGVKVALKYNLSKYDIFDIAYSSVELTKEEFDRYWDDPDEQDGVFNQGQDKQFNNFEFFPKWIKVRSNKHFVSIGLTDTSTVDYGFDCNGAKKAIKDIAKLKNIDINMKWLDNLDEEDIEGIVSYQLL